MVEPPEFEPCPYCGKLLRKDSDFAWKIHVDYECDEYAKVRDAEEE